ncbi:MAG: diguanylate cyclase protein [Herbinix sp.]|jgi:diguanylate cyclase (GGDEF)-like protein/PAS domain S-box-containing protein|nr:diguanylate cyclase protein [Herbinix sp.]
MNEFLQILSVIAAVLYLFVGVSVYQHNKHANVSKIFLLLNISLFLWSLFYSFAYTSETIYEFSIWNKLSAFGWCTFTAISLYLVMEITEDKNLKYWFVKALIIFPAPMFLYMTLFLFGANKIPSPFITNFFYKANFLYNFSYLFASIILLILWGNRASSISQKKQAKVIITTSLLSFLTNLIVQTILPALDVIHLPLMGHLHSLIMLFGVYYAITKYHFLTIPTSLVNKELFNEITNLTLLLDANSTFVKINKQVYDILGYTEKELVNQSSSYLFQDQKILDVLQSGGTITTTQRFHEINIPSKDGTMIPFSLSITPLYDSKLQAFLGLLIIGRDIRVTKLLQKNEELFRTMVEAVPFSIILSSIKDNTIIYVNKKTEEIFKAHRTTLKDSPAMSLYQDPGDRIKLFDDIKNDIPVTERKITFRRSDGSTFQGLITIVTTEYHDQDVNLGCISDITELINMNHMLMDRSIRDSLTALYNHQRVNELLETAILQSNITNEPLCVMMLDIDLFKRVNDTYGHQIGDKVLIEVSKLLLQNVRNVDHVGRYGGEEFIIVLPNITLSEASLLAEGIRLSVRDHDFGVENLEVTISIGLTQLTNDDSNTLVNRADNLLYQAKRNGRNRVEIYENNSTEITVSS